MIYHKRHFGGGGTTRVCCPVSVAAIRGRNYTDITPRWRERGEPGRESAKLLNISSPRLFLWHISCLRFLGWELKPGFGWHTPDKEALFVPFSAAAAPSLPPSVEPARASQGLLQILPGIEAGTRRGTESSLPASDCPAAPLLVVVGCFPGETSALLVFHVRLIDV